MMMKIRIIESKQNTITIPADYSGLPYYSDIIFGNRCVKSKVILDNVNKIDNRRCETPFIKMTSNLRDELLIPDSLIYQLQLGEHEVRIGPVIAFLLGNYDYTANYLQKYTTRMNIYSQIGGLFFIFTPDAIDFENKLINGYFYNINRSWELKILPFPSFIYVRNFSGISPELINKLKKITNNNIFNSYRFSKIELYNILNKTPEFSQYLPHTEKVNNFQQVKNFIDQNTALLKPVNSSGGRGIYFITRKGQCYELFGKYLDNPTIVKNNNLYKTLKNLDIFSRNYLLQKYVKLATINNSFFDIRVVMQRNTSGIWGCAGIEIRKAKKKQILTNLTQGGKPFSLAEGLKKAFSNNKNPKKIINKVLDLANDFCAFMDKSGENYFEFGIDIAIDVKNHIWFLEANVLPAYNGFKDICYNNYLFLLYNPIYYATSKTGFKIFTSEKNTVHFDQLIPEKYRLKN